MEFNLADLFENAVDHFGERECVVSNGKRRTYRELEARANRLAHHLSEHGVKAGDHVGIYALNSVEWAEAMWAILKLRAVFININYRYVEDELAYVFDNADLVALIYERKYAPRVANVMPNMPLLKHAIVIDDGTDTDMSGLDCVDYEQAMASASSARDFGARSGDDRYILYTGGTTGMPKGVVWRQEDVFFALGGGIDPATGAKAERPQDMVERGKGETPLTYVLTAPLMHGASQWSLMGCSFVGRKNVMSAQFDAADTWRLVAEEKANFLLITGDAMGRPLVEALPDALRIYDLSSLFALVSTAAVFSPAVKDEFFRLLPDLVMTDTIGSSESGSNGWLIVQKGNTGISGGGLNISPGTGTVVLGSGLRPLAPGSGEAGVLARAGYIPLEYYKDPKKTAETFVVGADGTRYAMPGDHARVEADGSITVLGRGSVCINSGGEKIFPEEVEAAIKSHPEAYDALVVGVPDERWGSRVAAVIQLRGKVRPTLEDIQQHCHKHIAGYKIPRELHWVEHVVRSPSGKPDYRWAKTVACDAQATESIG